MASKSIGGISVDLIAKTGKFRAGLEDATKRTRKFKKSTKGDLSSITKYWKVLGVAIGAIVTSKAIRGFKTIADELDSVAKTARGLGASSKGLAGLEYAAGFAGVEVEKLRGGLAKLNITLGDAFQGNNIRAVEAINALGLSLSDLSGLDTTEQFKLIGDALAGIEDPALRASYGSVLFGKSVTDLIPLLTSGSGAISKFQAQAEKLGLAFSEEELLRVEDMNDAMSEFNKTIRGKLMTFVVEFAPVVETLTEKLTAWVQTTEALNVNNGIQSLQEFGRYLEEDSLRLSGYLNQIIGVGAALKTIPTLLAGGMNLISSGIAGLLSSWSLMMKFLSQGWEWLIEKLLSGVEWLVNSIKSLFHNMTTWIITQINNLISKLAAIPMWKNPFKDWKIDLPEQPKKISFDAQINWLKNDGISDIFGDISESLAESSTQFAGIAEDILQFSKSSILDMSSTKDFIEDVGRSLSKPIKVEAATQAVSTPKPVVPKQIQTNTLQDILAQSRGYKTLSTSVEKYAGAMFKVKEVETKVLDGGVWTTRIEKISEKFYDLGESVEGAMDSIADGFADAIVEGGKFKDVITDVFKTFLKELLSAQIKQAIFNFSSAVGGMGGFFGSFGKILGFAEGGDPPVGKISMVGEKGPELFLPRSAGTIIPNNALGGSSGGTFYIDNRGASVEAVNRLESMIQKLNGTIEYRAINAVTNSRNRSPKFLNR